VGEFLKLNGQIVILKDVPFLLESDSSWQNELARFLEQWWNDSNTITFKTSGSTGKPKTIPFTKAQVRESARRTLDFFKIPEGTSAVLVLPTRYIAGKMMVIRAIVGKLNLVAVEPSENPWKNVSPKIDFAAATPQQFAAPESRSAMEKVMKSTGTLLVGGAPVSKQLKTYFNGLDFPVYETYGMTETLTHVAVRRLSHLSAEEFTVLPEVNLSTGNDQELLVQIDYLGKEPIRTRDRVEMTGNNQFRWLGRLDSVINSGGIKIFPEEVEAQFSEALSGINYFVHPVNDEKLGQKVVTLGGRRSRT